MNTIRSPRRKAGPAQFRAALFASAAAAALCVASAPSALAGPDACTGTTEVVCTGDQSDGVHYSGPEKLTVRDLSTNITPPNGQAGISLRNGGPGNPTATIEANVSPNSIITQGNNAPGILASAPGDVTIDVTIDSIGNIITDGVGSPAILAISGIGQTTVYNQANLSTYGSNADGVAARGPAGATVINSGEIGVRGANSDALYARTIVRG